MSSYPNITGMMNHIFITLPYFKIFYSKHFTYTFVFDDIVISSNTKVTRVIYVDYLFHYNIWIYSVIGWVRSYCIQCAFFYWVRDARLDFIKTLSHFLENTREYIQNTNTVLLLVEATSAIRITRHRKIFVLWGHAVGTCPISPIL